MQMLLAVLGSVVSTALSILWWLASYLLWVFIWFLLPFAVAGFIALRLAERTFGEKAVRAWVKARALKLGTGTWERVRPWLFALGAAPFRVLVWFVVYALWHALISILWRPRWQPWTRAWAKRWRAGLQSRAGAPRT